MWYLLGTMRYFRLSEVHGMNGAQLVSVWDAGDGAFGYFFVGRDVVIVC